ncbi:hypothetical protein CG723_26635 [Streptomyces sp. CB01635]|uniref:hypothetical protein n=1 Tax=unclassified Streptomyces TaxID=2593676 RepID=UPI000C27C07E|nr:hypothetical protein [Streptomyces sp. CB01635]PJN08676.1 hypothetical protein CG723_26635 [Streptomyces sp. CB01635]
MLRRGLKLTALAAVVVLALTGFSTGRGHGSGKSRGHSSSSSGGGCSSSKQNHSGSSSSTTGGSSYDDDDDSYGSSSSGSSGYTSGGSSYNRRPTRTPSTSGSGRSADITAKVLKCAGKDSPYASVELRNRGGRQGRYNLTIHFQDASDITVIDGSTSVTVPANGTKVAKVKPGGGADLLQSIDHCQLDGAPAPS